MATDGSQPLKVSEAASADLVALADGSKGQYHFVKKAATASSTHFAVGQLVVATAGDHNVLGVCQAKPTAAGQMCEVVVIGRTKVKSAGAITAGATLGPDATGLAQAVTVTGSTYTKCSVGILDQNADASTSDICTALVNCLAPLAGT